MLYKPIIKAMYQKTSTTKLTGRELSEAAEVLGVPAGSLREEGDIRPVSTINKG